MPEHPTNALIAEESPYLREAAHQPVDWLPWGEKALQRARDEGKPILVDSGAVWCHWCHVMDHESYEDPETAALINERFVPVKLDRDERPHVDQRLQRAVQALTGRGGWPLTAFLTPDGEVFYGGTYFPPEPTGGMPGFRQVLDQVADLFERQPDKAQEQARHIQEALEQRGEQPAEPAQASMAQVEEAVASALASYDPVHGGFGKAPKFPHPATLDLLLCVVERGRMGTCETAWDAVSHTLEAMGEGGMYDHLGGGFHRYSVDRRWHVPHFEKMLYDNAGFAGNYARAAGAARARGENDRADRFEDVCRGTVGFLLETLQLEEGGFGGSQDADRRPQAGGPLRRAELDDGSYFTWSKEEARDALDGEDLWRVARLHYGLDGQGDMEDGRHVLRIDATAEDISEALDRPLEEIEDLIDQATNHLTAARRNRAAPIVDPTLYVGWNAMAIEALLEHHRLQGNEPARQGALDALERILETAWDPDRGGLAHAISGDRARVHGLLEDQAPMLGALVQAFVVEQEARYLEAATKVADVLVDRYQRDDGRFRETLDDDRPADVADQPTPAPAATALLHLPRLARLAGEPRYSEAGAAGLASYLPRSEQVGGIFGGTLHLAALAHLDPPAHVVLVEEVGSGDGLFQVARASPEPYLTVVRVSDPDEPGVPEDAAAAARAFEGETVAVVCRGKSCQVAEDPDSLRSLLTPPTDE